MVLAGKVLMVLFTSGSLCLALQPSPPDNVISRMIERDDSQSLDMVASELALLGFQ